MAALREAAAAAVATEAHTGVPAELLLAQWAHETGHGKYTPGNNGFGLREYPGCFGRQLLGCFEWMTLRQARRWAAAKAGREAWPTGETRPGKRREPIERFECKDWFAVFPDLASSFSRRAQMYRVGAYAPHFAAYDREHDLRALIYAISPIYAAEGDYARIVWHLTRQKGMKEAIRKARCPKVTLPSTRSRSTRKRTRPAGADCTSSSMSSTPSGPCAPGRESVST